MSLFAGSNTTNSGAGLSHMGKSGCPCVDVSETFASIVSLKPQRSCTLPDGQTGILALDTLCLPFSYGSSTCSQFDNIFDPACDEPDPPSYCPESWCYVDRETCLLSSEERVYKSVYLNFPADEFELYYSYETCYSSQEDDFFLALKETQSKPLKGIAMKGAVPPYYNPFMYKRDPLKDVDDILDKMGNEYYDKSVPFEGVVIDYLRSIMAISKGDVNITYAPASQAGRKMHPEAFWTGAVQDVSDGLFDLGIAPFYVTKERLQLAPFTVPIFNEKAYLVIPRPNENENSFFEQVFTIFVPFSIGLWLVIIGVIVLSAITSVWLSRIPYSEGHHGKKRMYTRHVMDAVLQKSMFFCSAGIEQDSSASFPAKMLMFGFSFFILIVSAYVANLAAFLNADTVTPPTTIETAIKDGKRICALPGIKGELEAKWDKAMFVFDDEGGYNYGPMVEMYKKGECDMLVVGDLDFDGNIDLMDDLCEMDLVATNSLVLETPLAFPVNPSLAAGISYWIFVAEKFEGVTLKTAFEDYNDFYNRHPACKIQLSAQELEPDELVQLNISNMAFPIILFLGCVMIATVLEVWSRYHPEDQPEYLGRQSRVGTIMMPTIPSRFAELSSSSDDDNISESRRMAKQHTTSTFKLSSNVPEVDGNNLLVSSIANQGTSGASYREFKDFLGHESSENDPENPEDDNSTEQNVGNPEDDNSTEQHVGNCGAEQNSGSKDDLTRFQQLVSSGKLDELEALVLCFKDMKKLKES